MAMAKAWMKIAHIEEQIDKINERRPMADCVRVSSESNPKVDEFRDAMANRPTLEPPRKHFHWLIDMQRMLPGKPIGVPQLGQAHPLCRVP